MPENTDSCAEVNIVRINASEKSFATIIYISSGTVFYFFLRLTATVTDVATTIILVKSAVRLIVIHQRI